MAAFKYGFTALKCPLCKRFKIRKESQIKGKVFGLHLSLYHTDEGGHTLLCTHCDRTSPWGKKWDLQADKNEKTQTFRHGCMRPYKEGGEKPEDTFKCYEVVVSIEFARKVYREILKDYSEDLKLIDKYLPLKENVKKTEPKIQILELPGLKPPGIKGGIDEMCTFLENGQLKELYKELSDESDKQSEEASTSKEASRLETKAAAEEDSGSDEVVASSSFEQEHDKSFDTVKSDPGIVTSDQEKEESSGSGSKERRIRGY